MNEFESAILWCAMQSTLVAGLGLAASSWLGRRSAAAAAIVATSAAATILAVTLLAAPSRGVVSLDAWFTATAVQSSASGAAATVAGSPESAPAQAESVSGGVSVADLQAGLRRLVAAAEHHVEERSSVFRLAIVAVVASAGVGLARLAIALRRVRRVRAESIPVACPRLRTLFARMVDDTVPRQRPELRESAQLDSPATCGWRRAVVILPVERSGWTDAQLRAALAHELAHVVRGDFAWRLAASVAAAIYLWHPLVHWLVRRAALMQELAADRLAAAAMEGSATYLRAISELALRWDDSSRRRATPVVLPALSSNLMRRIAVLRSKDGNGDSSRSRVLGVVVATLIALVGAATLAVAPVAEAVESLAKVESTAMFARKPFDPALAGHSEQGLFVIRVAELADQPAFQELFELTRHGLRQDWAVWFSGAEAPELRLDAVEYIAGAPTLTLRNKTGDAADEQGQLMIGSGEQVIRFHHDVAWREWIDKHMPGAEEVADGELTYVRLPLIPALGPERMCVAARDTRTLILTLNVERLRTLATAAQPVPTDRDATWQALDGGIFTALFAAPEIGAAFDLTASADATSDEAQVRAAANVVVRAMSSHMKQVGVGVDLDPATNRLALRLRLACTDKASAERTREALEAFLPLWRVGLAASRAAGPQGPGDPNVHAIITPENERFHREGHDFWLRLIDTCRVICEQQDDGSTHVCVTASATHPSTLVNSQAVAVTDEAAERR